MTLHLLIISLVAFAQNLQANAEIPRGFVDGAECLRECNGVPMNCYFDFRLETYYSMSKACYNCPEVLSDCFRMDCIIGGGLKRTVTVANRKLPGPAIEVCEGDNIKVLVQNMLDTGESTSIHWHGLHMKETPYMDGVPFITQCPILSRNNFTYDFFADISGTHFWHSHLEMQRGDGLFGALIIRQQPEDNVHQKLYDYDLSEHVIIITDWENRPRMDFFQSFSQGNSGLQPSGMIINGLGTQPDSESLNTPIANFTVQQGFTYRFRVISANFFDCPTEISIDNHRLMVISTDGQDIQPVLVDTIMINGGERFDFLINATQTISTYWIRVRGQIDCGRKEVFQVGTLQYEGTTNDIPTEPMPTYDTAYNSTGIVLNPMTKNSSQPVITIDQLRSIKPLEEGFNAKNYKKFFLTFDLSMIDNPKYHRSGYYGFDQAPSGTRMTTTQTNRISFKPFDFAMLPSRHKINENEFCTAKSMADQNCSEKFCSCTQALQVDLGDVVEMVFIELADQRGPALHPIHLHGHAFRVVSWHEIGENLTRAEIIENYSTYPRNLLDNPPIKDTVTIPRGGVTIVRFIADNPGYWFLHCHIESHALEGMAVVLKVGSNDQMVEVPEGFPTCGNFAMKPPEDDVCSKVWYTLKNIFGFIGK